MFDKTKLEALRAKYQGAKETEVAPAEFRKALSLVFGSRYQRAMPFAGISTLLDLPYRPEAADQPDFGGLDFSPMVVLLIIVLLRRLVAIWELQALAA